MGSFFFFFVFFYWGGEKKETLELHEWNEQKENLVFCVGVRPYIAHWEDPKWV